MKRSLLIVLAIVLASVLIAGVARTRAINEEQNKREVARLTGKLKTVCVGRFLIDVPDAAEIELRQPRIDGFEIASFSEIEQEFQKRVADRVAQIRAKPDYLGGSKNMEMAKEVKTGSGLVGKIFVHSRTVDEGTWGNGLGGVERYRHEGITTEALVHGQGISIDLFFEDRDPDLTEDLPTLVNQLVANPTNRIPDGIQNLTKLVAQLVPHPENMAPVEPGFCIDRAYFRDPLTAKQGEQIPMSAVLPSHPDVDFMLIIAAGLKPDEQGLLERSAAAEARMALEDKARVSRLRAAPRKIAGLPGEELVEVFVEENDARVHSFWWEVNGTKDDVFVPHFVFKMNTGTSSNGPVPSSLSDGVALRLWDTILSSIRVRPTHQGHEDSAVPAPLPKSKRVAASP